MSVCVIFDKANNKAAFPTQTSMSTEGKCCSIWGVLVCWMSPLATHCHTHPPFMLYLSSKFCPHNLHIKALTKPMPYSGKLLREKNFCELVKNTIFAEKVSQITRFCCDKGCHAPKFWLRKLLRIATKIRNSQKFSPSKVSHYTVPQGAHTTHSSLRCSPIVLAYLS